MHPRTLEYAAPRAVFKVSHKTFYGLVYCGGMDFLPKTLNVAVILQFYHFCSIC
jgi:hypothetical protein